MTSTAVKVASWRRTRAGRGFGLTPTPVGVVVDGGTGAEIGLTVELYLGEAWVDISPFVYYKNRVKITRGRGDETAQVSPQTCTFTINNRDGRFSPRNPVGPYYGQIGRNTPVRVSRLQNGIRRYRFHGEIPSWPTTWDISGTDVYSTITAAGQLRRLSQGSAVLGSALYRAYTGPIVTGSVRRDDNAGPLPLAAYWPCQDGTTATSIASGTPGNPAMTLSGQALPQFAQDNSFPCSDPLPLLSASIWTGTVPAYTGGVDNIVNFLLAVPTAGAFDTAVVFRLLTAGPVARVDVQYLSASNGSLQMLGYGPTGTLLFSSTAITGVNGSPMRVQMTLFKSGSDILWILDTQAVVTNASGSGNVSALLASTAIGNVTSVVVNPDGHLDDVAVGHVAVEYSYATQLVDASGPLLAWFLDYPDVSLVPEIPSRFERLCLEQGVPAVVIPGSAVNETYSNYGITTMGTQPSDVFLNLIQQSIDTGLGLLFESRDQAALAVRTRGSLYNQSARLTLDYAQSQLSDPPVPVDDDALTRNNVTVTRINGSSATAKLTSGPLSNQAPPNGVGDYPATPQISLFDDSSLPDQAGWRMHMGTVDEPRFPSVSINLRHPQFTSSVDLMNAAITIDIGDRLVINNPPPWMPPDPISQIVQGYTETLGVFEHDVTFNCSPESPYRIAILEDTVLGRADTDDSTLSAAISSTALTFQVATTNAGSPLWTTAAGDFPFDIAMGGERITLSGISGAASPQTFTASARSVNGVVKAQKTGTDIRLWQPMILSL